MVNAKELYNVLQDDYNLKIIKNNHPKMKNFEYFEVVDFIEGKTGKIIEGAFTLSLTRSFQITQALSTIGANLKRDGTDDKQTYSVYKRVWDLTKTSTCSCCKKKYQQRLMMNSDICTRKACLIKQWADR